METPVHGALPAVRQPEIPRIQGQMGQRRAELRVSFSQVCRIRIPNQMFSFFGLEY